MGDGRDHRRILWTTVDNLNLRHVGCVVMLAGCPTIITVAGLHACVVCFACAGAFLICELAELSAPAPPPRADVLSRSTPLLLRVVVGLVVFVVCPVPICLLAVSPDTGIRNKLCKIASLDKVRCRFK
jgi:hypothetical protein